MSSDHAHRGVHVSAGEGIVAHLTNLTAFARGEETRLNELLVRLNALADAPWREVVRTLTAGITEANYEEHPDLACVSIGSDRVFALVYGKATLTIVADGKETILDGEDSSTWIDVAIHGNADRVHAGHQSPSVLVGVLRDGVVPAGGFLLDTAGPMPSSARWFVTSDEPEPIETAEPSPLQGEATQEQQGDATQENNLAGIFARLPQRNREEASMAEDSNEADSDETDADETDAEETTEADVLVPPRLGALPDEHPSPAANTDEDPSHATDTTTDDLEPTESHANQTSTDDGSSTGEGPTASPMLRQPSQPPPLPKAEELAPQRPQLRGVLCPDGHLTSVNDLTCRTCGIATDPEAEIVMGDRPVLGLLTFDDGAVLAVDRPAAVGSAVPPGYEIDGELATIVRLDDGVDGISAVQVEVKTIGWEVEIHDMNSENGTYTILHGERQTRTRLRAGQSVVLQQGMTVELGGRHFDFTIGARHPEDAV